MNRRTQKETKRDGGPATLTDDERHSLLSVELRRITLDVLAEVDGPVDLHDLAVDIAAREAGVAAVDDATVSRVALILHHAHLPKMAEMGVVEYDAESTRIRTHP